MQSALLANDLFVIPIIGILVAMTIYFAADPVVFFVKKKTFINRDEIIRLMKLMQMDVNENQVNWAIIAITYGPGTLFFLLFWPNVAPGSIFALAAIIGGMNLPLLIMRHLYEKRCIRFVNQMVDALTIMANGIKSGSNPQQSMQRVIDIMGNPVSAEFSRVVGQVQFGQSFEEALTDLGERIPRADVQMFVTSINILKETGGNLAETFQTIVQVIRERQKLEQKIQAMTAQGIMQGIIVSCVPFFLGAMFYFMDPDYIKPMFTTAIGMAMLVVMLGLQITGGIVIRKLVTIKV